MRGSNPPLFLYFFSISVHIPSKYKDCSLPTKKVNSRHCAGRTDSFDATKYKVFISSLPNKSLVEHVFMYFFYTEMKMEKHLLECIIGRCNYST